MPNPPTDRSPMSSGRRPGGLGGTCLLLVVAASLALLPACGAGDPASTVSGDSARDGLSIEPATIDVGVVAPGSPAVFDAVLVNNGPEPISVASAVPDCGCIEASWPAAPIAPGARAAIVVRVAPTDSQAGTALRKKVSFVVEGGDPVVLEVVGSVAGDGVRPSTKATRPSTVQPGELETVFIRTEPPIRPGVEIAFPVFEEWIRGERETGYEPGRVYVLEYFATTCGHCMEHAALIKRLMDEYRAKGVRFIAVTDEPREVVERWLESVGHGAECVVSDTDRSSQSEIQGGTYRPFTPSFFVIKDGELLWYGHPEDSEAPLEAIVSGSWDPESARGEAVVESVVARARDFLTNLTRSCQSTGDWSVYLPALESVREAIPERANDYDLQLFTFMINRGGRLADGYALARRLAEANPLDMELQRSIARAILTGPYVAERDVALAASCAEAADSLADGKDALAANTLAYARFAQGDRERALAEAQRSVDLAEDPKAKAAFERDLAKFKLSSPGPEPARPVPGATGAAVPRIPPAEER